MEYQTTQIGNATITVWVDPNAPEPVVEPPKSELTPDKLRTVLIAAGMTEEAVTKIFTIAEQL